MKLAKSHKLGRNGTVGRGVCGTSAALTDGTSFDILCQQSYVPMSELKTSSRPGPGDRVSPFWSLRELLESYASTYSSILEDLDLLKGYLDLLTAEPQSDFQQGMDALKRVSKLCRAMKPKLTALEMHISAIQCQRLVRCHRLTVEALEVGGTERTVRAHIAPKIATDIAELMRRIQDELSLREFFYVRPGLVEYYRKNQFKKAAVEMFPEAAFDMEEAGKCFALGRHTAVVFHAMRVVEAGVLHVKEGYGITASTKSWGAIAEAMLVHIRKAKTGRRLVRAAEIRERLLALKDAYRNPTMHHEKVYTEEHAKEVLDAARNFMEVLAAEVRTDDEE